MAYYALAENAWNAAAKRSEAQIVHNFGRADQVDRQGLKRLVDSINRVLDQDDAVTRGAQEIPQIELDRVFELGVVLAACTLSSSPTTTRCPPRMWRLDTKAPGSSKLASGE